MRWPLAGAVVVTAALLAAGCATGQPAPTVTVTRTVTVAPRPSAASAAAAPAGPSVAYSCRLGFANNDAPPLLPLTKQNSGFASAFLITFKNTSHQDVTLHSVTMESISSTGQEIDSQTVGDTSSVNPAGLPYLLAPGEHITMQADFGDFPSTVTVSTATYLHSHCVVTGWS